MQTTEWPVPNRDRLYICSYGGRPYHGSRATAPASGTTGGGNRIFFSPFSVISPYAVSRVFWCNGATVGTDKNQVGIYDEAFNLRFASRQIVTSGTSQIQYGPPGTHAREALQEANINVAQDTYTTNSVTMRAGVLYLLSVTSKHASNAPAISSVTGGGTWSSRSTTQYDGTLKRASIWSCVPTVDFTGTLDIFFGTSSGVTGIQYEIMAVYGVDTATNDGVVQQATNTGTGVDVSATLSAFGSADNGTFQLVCSNSSSSGHHSFEAGWTEFADSGANGHSIGVAYTMDNDTTPTDTLSTSQNWGICALELKAATTWVLPQGRYWMAFNASGTTTTVLRQNASDGAKPANLASGDGPALPIAPTVSGQFSDTRPVFGLTRRVTP